MKKISTFDAHCYMFIKERANILLLILILLVLSPLVASYTVEALIELGDRSSAELRSTASTSLIVEKENERLKEASKNLPSTKKALGRILNGGGPDQGILAEGMLQACVLETDQGRRISILKATSGGRMFTDVSQNAEKKIVKKTSIVFGENSTPPDELDYLRVNKYPVELLRASGNGTVFEIDDSKANDAEKVIDLTALCETSKDRRTSSRAQVNFTNLEQETKRFKGNAFGPIQKDLDSPYGRFTSNNGLVHVRYDTIEVTLQAVAVVLFLVELIVLEDLKKRRCRYYHVCALSLLLVAAVISTGMGHWKVLNVLKEQNFAWESCGSYNIQRTLNNSIRQGYLYEAHCEWVIIRATSSWQAYLILLPSGLGLLLLIYLLARFAVYKTRRKTQVSAEDDKIDGVDAVNLSSEFGGRRKHRSLSQILSTSTVFLALCIGVTNGQDTCSVAGFPPKKGVQSGLDLVFDKQAIFVGGVASSGTWRCGWESGPQGSGKDSTSCATVDDCFVRWAAPKEDLKTGFLIGSTRVINARCNLNSICPFTGRRCTENLLKLNDTFGCTARFKFPPPITYLTTEEIRKSEKWCRFGTPLVKAFCHGHWMNYLARRELKSLVLQIKEKLGDRPVNTEKLSEYEFPDCAGLPTELGGRKNGLGAEFEHPSSRGAKCINSKELKARAIQNSRTFCAKKLVEQGICGGVSRYGLKSDCPRKLIALCSDTVYHILLIKSKTLRATDDWMVSRCHRGGLTAFGKPDNWTMNNDAVLLPTDQVPTDEEGFPLVRPIRTGWRFRESEEDRLPMRPTLDDD